MHLNIADLNTAHLNTKQHNTTPHSTTQNRTRTHLNTGQHRTPTQHTPTELNALLTRPDTPEHNKTNINTPQHSATRRSLSYRPASCLYLVLHVREPSTPKEAPCGDERRTVFYGWPLRETRALFVFVSCVCIFFIPRGPSVPIDKHFFQTFCALFVHFLHRTEAYGTSDIHSLHVFLGLKKSAHDINT